MAITIYLKIMIKYRCFAYITLILNLILKLFEYDIEII